MVLHFKIIGILMIALAALHGFFPKYFNWKKELKTLSLVNQQIMKVHTFFIALMLFLMGLLCMSSPIELIETNLGKRISLGLGLFWLVRLLIQFFGYSAQLWKGKKVETSIHILFSLLWFYFTYIFLFNYLT